MINKTTMSQCWLEMEKRPSSAVAVRVHRSSGWKDISWQVYSNDIETTAAGLLSLGVKPGDRVALMSNTRYEWGCVDFGVSAIGAVAVPIYQNNMPEDVEYILNDSGATIFVTENRATLKLWRQISEKCPKVQKVICFETDAPTDSNLLTWDALKEQGAGFLDKNRNAVRELATKTKSTDLPICGLQIHFSVI